MEMIHEGNRCPTCEEGTLTRVTKEVEFTYKGDTLRLQREVLICPSCEEAFFSPQDEREIEKLLTDRRRRVDGLLTSEEIRSIRRQFKMTQVEFATYLRVSKKTFARYETGQATQSYAMDDLLRILQRYPEAFQVFTQKKQTVHQMPQGQDALAKV